MTEHIIRVADFAAGHPKAWRTVRAAAVMPELGHSELSAFLRISKRTVLRHLGLFRQSDKSEVESA
jgi:hypothetical protein